MKRFIPRLIVAVLALGLVFHPRVLSAVQLEESMGGPRVVETFPREKAVDIPVDSRVMILFSRPLRRSDVNEFTVTLNDGVADIASTVQYNGELKKVVLIPLEDLLPRHVYYVNVSRTIRDEDGNALGRDHHFQFRTVDEIVRIPPVISAISPTVGGEDVDPGCNIEISFSAPMDETSLNETNISLRSGREKVVGIVRYYPSLSRAVFVPDRQLELDTSYTVRVDGVKDARGVALEHPREWSFRTRRVAPRIVQKSPRPDTVRGEEQRLRRIRERIGPETAAAAATATEANLASASKPTGALPPLLVEQYPAAGIDGVAPDTELRVRFREAMNPATLNIFHFALKEGNDFIFGRVEYEAESRLARFIPAGRLKPNTLYTVVLSGRLEKADGSRIGKDLEWSFRTVAPLATFSATRPTPEEKPDMVAPQVLAVVPAERAEEVDPGTEISARFNEALKDFSVNSFTFRVNDGENDIEGRTSWNEAEWKAVFRPVSPLRTGRVYTALLTRGIMDRSGNYMQAEKRWTFLVGQRWNTATPRLVSISPAPGRISATEAPLLAQFSEPLNARLVKNEHVRLLQGRENVPGEVTLLPDGKTVSFRPLANLRPGGAYRLELARELEGANGQRLEAPVHAEFIVEEAIPDSRPPATSVAATDDARLEMAVIEELQQTPPPSAALREEAAGQIGPEEMKEGLARSDKFPAGQLAPRRIRDETAVPIGRKDLLGRTLTGTDRALKDDVRRQLEKFLGESSRENRELLARVEKINDREQATLAAAAVSAIPETRVTSGKTAVDPGVFMMQRERENLFKDELPYDELRRLSAESQVTAPLPAEPLPSSNIVADDRHRTGEGTINGIPISQLDPSLAAPAPEREALPAPLLTPVVIDDPDELMVTAIHPKRNRINVNPEEIITVSFNRDVDLSTVNGMSFIVSCGEELVDGRIIYNPRLNKVIFRPKEKLKAGVGYRVHLTSGVRTRDGQPLRPIDWEFETAAM